jgi:endonuclease/exonuclease/phosphatase (EEP) superfamily protein YafD
MKYLLPTVILLYAVSLLGELGSFWWVFELLSHWRILYCVVGLVLLALALLLRLYKWAFVAGTILTCHILVVTAAVPIFKSQTAQATEVLSRHEVAEPPLRVVFANTYWKSKDMNQVVRAVGEMQPDIIFMEELQPEQFEEVRVEYAFDMAVFSKVPVVSHTIISFMPSVPLIEVVVERAGKPAHILGVHPRSPVSAQFAEQRNTYLEDLFSYVDTSKNTIVMGGDFNITQFSPIMRELLKNSRMIDTQKDFPLVNTWPTHFPSWAAIPIDHVFVTSDVQVNERYRGTATGSDHWPIVVEVSW